MAYNKDTDYSALMEAAAARGDYAAAGAYEKQRNEKIAGEGLNYEQTNRYTGNLDKTDYGDRLKSQMAGGASVNDVADTLRARNQKISTAENLSPYANDDLSHAALEYIAKVSGNNGFSYAAAPAYASKYQGAIDSLVGDILSGSYEKWTQGADYAALKDRYTQNGKLAMRDTLAETSARTGGLDSTYAQAAAQQTYGGYMANLEAAAREMYGAERSDKLDSLSMLRGLDGDAYGRFADSRSFNYQLGRDSVSDARYEREYADQTAQQALENERRAQSDADEKALMAAQISAVNGNYKPLADYYGVSESEARAYMLKEAAPRLAVSDGGLQSNPKAGTGSGSAKSSSGGGTRSAGSSSGNGDTSGILMTMLGFDDDLRAYDYLLGRGLTSSQFDKTLDMYYAERNKGGENDAVPKDDSTPKIDIREYGEAVSYLRENGAANAASSLMTRQEWARHKNSKGQAGAETRDYNSYEEYLQAYIEYALEVG